MRCAARPLAGTRRIQILAPTAASASPAHPLAPRPGDASHPRRRPSARPRPTPQSFAHGPRMGYIRRLQNCPERIQLAMFYDPMMTAPMRDELTRHGVRSLETPEQVDELLGQPDTTTLLVVNSVCGCAAANARPGVALAVKHATQPDHVATVFAGVDREATNKARSYIKGYMPSSPSIALLKNGQVAFMLQRHEIEGRSPQDIAAKLTAAFDAHCKA